MPTTTSSITNQLSYTNQGDLANTPFSISFWFYIDDWSANGVNPVYLFQIRSSTAGTFGIYFFVRTATGAVRFNKAQTGATPEESPNFAETATNVVVQKRWYHVIGSCTGTAVSDMMKLWVNGAQTTSSVALPASDTIAFTGTQYVHGRGSATLGLNGRVHKLIAIKGREFTESERAELFVGRLPATLDYTKPGYTGHQYFRADYDANINGVEEDGAELSPSVTGTVSMTNRYPGDLPGLAAWYDFSGSNVFENTAATDAVEDEDAVAAVTDRSGNTNTITQATAANQPKWTNKAPWPQGRMTMSLQTGTDQAFLNNPSGSVFHNRYCSIVRIGAGPQAAGNGGREQRQCSLGGDAIILTSSFGRIGFLRTSGGTQDVYSTYFHTNGAPDITGIIASSDGVVRPFRGSKLGNAIAATITSVTPAAGIRVGGYSAGNAPASDQGELWGYLFYQRPLDETDLYTLNQWANTTYGISTSRRRLLWILGASTSYGTAATFKRGFTRRLTQSFLNDTLLINHGSGGQRMTDFINPPAFTTYMLDPIPSDLTELGLPSGAPMYAFLPMPLVNDFTFQTGETTDSEILLRITSQFDTIAGACRAKGMKVIAVVPWQGANMAAHPTAYSEYVEWIQGSASSLYDALIDFRNPAISTPYFLSDGAHTDDNGHQAIADALEATILNLELTSSMGAGGSLFRSRGRGRMFRWPHSR